MTVSDGVWDEWSDWNETVVLSCKKPLCGWSTTVDWSDFDRPADGVSNARRVFSEHYQDAHAALAVEGEPS